MNYLLSKNSIGSLAILSQPRFAGSALCSNGTWFGKSPILMALFVGLTLQGAQDASISHRVTKRSANESPHAGYGLRLLPALWSTAVYNPYQALLFGGATLCTLGCALYCKPAQTTKIIAATLALSSLGGSAYWAHQTPPNLYFLDLDEASLAAHKLIFPLGFLFASGGSAYQIEGCGVHNGGQDMSTYTDSYRKKHLLSFKDPSGKDKPEVDRLTNLFAHTFTALDGVGIACNEWNLYEQDAMLKAKMGINADRFSIERFKVETAPGVFNLKAIEHYRDKAVTLIKLRIRPIIGMHHYSDPAWFMDAGGFEDKNNLDGFAHYCAIITGAIYDACMEFIGNDPTKQDLIPLFYTYNSANAYAINGYQQGTRPPYVKNMGRSRTVLFNMLEAHMLAYKKMKKAAPKALIGTTINVYQLDPVNYLNPVHRTLCFAGNYLQNYSVYDFFKDKAKKGQQCLDWVGLNYYSHGYMKSPSGPFANPQDVPFTGNPLTEAELKNSKFASTANQLYTIYADGLFLALHEINENVSKIWPKPIPIIITETGLGVQRADAHADANGYDALETQEEIDKRTLFLKHYLYAASQAYQVGIPLIGISIWSFMDNYEWGQYDKRYGLFAVDFTQSSKPRLRRKGAQYYWDAIKTHNKRYKK